MLPQIYHRLDNRESRSLERAARAIQIASVPPLHITKVAFACESVEILAARIAARAEGGEVTITTRYRPTRHAELIGGSLFWIVKHRLAARSRILGFVETEGEKRWQIRLAAELVAVRARPKRAHQGWRYLKGEDAPADVAGDDSGLAALPPKVLDELARIALI